MNFSDFTLNNQGVTDLNKVMFDAIFKYSNLFSTCTALNGVKNGEYLDSVDKMSDIGWAGRKCNPDYKDVNITGRENRWALGDWSAPIEFCYKKLESTIAEYCLRTGTPRENIIGTEFWNKIFMPLFNDALTRMYWRMAWFGDTAADNVASGGVLTDGVDKTLFTMADGLWKRIFAATAASQKTAIAANNEASYANQLAKLRTQGAAIKVVEDILMDANSLISGGVLLMTKSIYDALQKDYRKTYSATMPYMTVAEGVEIPSFDGVAIVKVPEWDTIIREYEDNGTKWNNPHRALFVNPDNLLVGTSDTDLFAELTTGFDDKGRVNYNYLASNIGTLINDSRLVQAAY